MAKLIVGKECERYVELLRQLELMTDDILGHSIYEGAKIITDKMDEAVDQIPKHSRQGKTSKGITDSQRAGLHAGLGIARMRNDGGYVNVKVGMDGYNSTVTKKYPKGQPNAMIARVIESGSTYHAKTPFISKTVNAYKDSAEKAMAKKFDEIVAKKMI